MNENKDKQEERNGKWRFTLINFICRPFVINKITLAKVSMAHSYYGKSWYGYSNQVVGKFIKSVVRLRHRHFLTLVEPFLSCFQKKQKRKLKNNGEKLKVMSTRYYRKSYADRVKKVNLLKQQTVVNFQRGVISAKCHFSQISCMISVKGQKIFRIGIWKKEENGFSLYDCGNILWFSIAVRSAKITGFLI